MADISIPSELQKIWYTRTVRICWSDRSEPWEPHFNGVHLFTLLQSTSNFPFFHPPHPISFSITANDLLWLIPQLVVALFMLKTPIPRGPRIRNRSFLEIAKGMSLFGSLLIRFDRVTVWFSLWCLYLISVLFGEGSFLPRRKLGVSFCSTSSQLFMVRFSLMNTHVFIRSVVDNLN